MSGFNAKTLQVLRQAGWHPNRRTDIAAIAARSAVCGYEIGENVRAFVREFDGLSVGYPDGNFLFEFRARSEYCSREWFLEIANMVGENGLVVGSTPAVFFDYWRERADVRLLRRHRRNLSCRRLHG